jgi:hypothetical protein
MTLKSKWTAGLKEEEKEELTSLIKGSARVLERLNYLIDQKLQTNYKQMIQSDSYATSNWSEYQADRIGYIRAMEEIKGYLTLK